MYIGILANLRYLIRFENVLSLQLNPIIFKSRYPTVQTPIIRLIIDSQFAIINNCNVAKFSKRLKSSFLSPCSSIFNRRRHSPLDRIQATLGYDNFVANPNDLFRSNYKFNKPKETN